MGSWGVGSFENDGACDWVYELEKVKNLGLIEQAIGRANSQEYVDCNIGEEAVAACEVLAALRGRPGQKLPESLTTWATQNPHELSANLLEQAQLALRRIDSRDSELQEVWGETGLFKDWQAAIEDLHQRLT